MEVAVSQLMGYLTVAGVAVGSRRCAVCRKMEAASKHIAAAVRTQATQTVPVLVSVFISTMSPDVAARHLRY